MKSNQLAYIYGLGAVLLWSTVATAFKVALGFFSPLQLVFVAVVTSIIALSGILIYQGKLNLLRRQFLSRPQFYLMSGILNPFLYYYVLFAAYDLLPAQQALSLNYTWAILLPILSVPLLGHKLTKTDIVAAVIAYLGVFIIATGGNITNMSFDSPLGITLGLFSTVLWCLYWIINTKDTGNPIVSLLLSFIIGLPLVVITLLFTDSLPSLNLNGLLAGMYVGLFEMGITFVLWLMALKHTDKAANMSTMVFLTPVLSVGFISWILQEDIQNSTYIGLCFILCGLAIQKLMPKMNNKVDKKMSL
ncbi:DMT family transporter [Shewanella gaetbuli]|uniref:DMT family transporter n=1 Tax=Shewanella gaetbuli TaxID=220752 RepID=A0A9X1ZK28_9GAMM|nr:DMT family transporter [Shewanella gaetbuli]MCL1141307.1 DMT family transporter [Shewanella gaetbuli]